MEKQIIDAVASLGFDVYMRKPDDTFMIFTDGKRLGYIQYSRSRGLSLSSVHKPNRTTGTGYSLAEGITEISREILASAFMVCPHWDARNYNTVQKYKDIEDFRARDSFNAAYQLVAKGLADEEDSANG